MKRRTRLKLVSCAASCGTFLLLSTAPSGASFPGVVGIAQPMVPTSGSPPGVVPTPMGSVTVSSGDTLTAIGARTSRTWEQLAGFNHLPNPNLIYVDQVLTIPPADYVAPPPPTPVVQAQPVVIATVEPATPTTATPTPTSSPAPPPTPPPGGAPSSGGGGAWSRVATCEEGGANSPTYGYFGIMPSSWAAYGGTAYSPTAGGSSWDTQVMIANKISGGNVPDAYGCASW